MSLHINRFIDNIKAHESRGQRDFSMTLRDAKDLHADITKLLLTLEAMRSAVPTDVPEQIISIELTGGNFKNT